MSERERNSTDATTKAQVFRLVCEVAVSQKEPDCSPNTQNKAGYKCTIFFFFFFAIAQKGQRAAALIPEVETGLYSLGSYKWKMRTETDLVQA